LRERERDRERGGERKRREGDSVLHYISSILRNILAYV